MINTSKYNSPLGEILLAVDEKGLIGCWFENQKYYASTIYQDTKNEKNKLIKQAENWLDEYFTGIVSNKLPELHLIGTDFQIDIWNILLTIPYSKTTTYGDIAKKMAIKKGIDKMSAQAVGNAVGHNPISIFVPCHRVLGNDGKLVGYAGGLEKKKALLDLEQHFMNKD